MLSTKSQSNIVGVQKRAACVYAYGPSMGLAHVWCMHQVFRESRVDDDSALFLLDEVYL